MDKNIFEEININKEEFEKQKGKSLLSKEEMKEFLKNVSSIDKRVDHSRAYRTLMNETRRELLKFIGYEVRSMDDIINEFPSVMDQLNYHLSMLKQCLYIIDSEEGWKSTPRGIGFLENAQMGDI